MSRPNTQDVLDRIDREKSRYLEELETYLRIPSVSTDPEHDEDVDRCSRFLAERMEEAGLTVRRIDAGGHPLVYGEWLEAGADAPTVLFYGHYDVQPVDPLDEWRHPPFEPTREGDDLVARGATDDKGQSYTHLKAVEAILAERGRLPVNVRFLVEGEEESGGEAIESWVREHGEEIPSDCVVISDSSMYAPGQPSLVYGLRGMAYMEIRVQGPNRDLHSGSYGGAVVNPLNALCEIVARLKDPETGRVLVPGFYDRVIEPEEWEREEIAGLPFDEEAYRQDLRVPELGGEEGFTTLERVGIRPTCDVNGIFGGYMGQGAKTVLPAWGGAKVSMRLVPDQDPEEIAARFEEHVEAVAPAGVKVSVKFLHGGVPVLVESEGPFMEAAQAALADTWGKEPVKVREGGSIPVVATFSEVLAVPVLLMGYGLPDDRLHSPNEKMSIPQFFDGIRCTARFLDRLGSGQE